MATVEIPARQWYEWIDRFTRIDELLEKVLIALNRSVALQEQQATVSPITGIPSLDALIEEVKFNRAAGYWFLPFSNNIDFEFIQKKNLEIATGELQVLADLDTPGWFLSGYITGTSGKLRLRSEMRFVGGEFAGDANAAELNAQGLTFPNVFQLWCPKFDDVAGVYTVVFTPSPWMPFKNRLRVTVKNEDTATKVYTATIHILKVTGLPQRVVETG